MAAFEAQRNHQSVGDAGRYVFDFEEESNGHTSPSSQLRSYGQDTPRQKFIYRVYIASVILLLLGGAIGAAILKFCIGTTDQSFETTTATNGNEKVSTFNGSAISSPISPITTNSSRTSKHFSISNSTTTRLPVTTFSISQVEANSGVPTTRPIPANPEKVSPISLLYQVGLNATFAEIDCSDQVPPAWGVTLKIENVDKTYEDNVDKTE